MVVDSVLSQTLAAGMIVVGALAFLGRRTLRTLAAMRGKATAAASCHEVGACGCAEIVHTNTERPGLAPHDR
jgi:hypothetical protein